jgi:putative FmdB family regulatory protein
MPIYEYRCERGHTFEVMQRMSDEPVAACQECSAPVQRVFHPVAVHFKGSGFYNTDYGTRKRAREKAEAGSGSDTSSGSDSEGKGTSDAKGDSKTSSDSKSSKPSSSSTTSAKAAD